MIAVEIAQYLHAQGHGTWDPTGPTGDIYIDEIPDTADSGMSIRASGGPGPDANSLVSRPAVQIIVRGSRSAKETGDLAAAVMTSLHGLHDTVFVAGGTRVMLCTARQSEPIPLGRDENQRYEYSMNFQLITGGE